VLISNDSSKKGVPTNWLCLRLENRPLKGSKQLASKDLHQSRKNKVMVTSEHLLFSLSQYQ
jgi:hypothetical protein